jgi:lipopolysaccharide transport system permease protein
MDQTVVTPSHVTPAPALVGSPLPSIVIEARRNLWHLNLKELWHYRELLYFLVWRDVKIRYKQTVIGATWVVLQPVLTMMIFTVVFSYFAKIPSDGVPYPIFAYAALLPWIYFSQAIGRCASSVIGDSSLITKIYFPRLIIPLASVIPPLFDFCWSLFILFGMMAWYGIGPTWGLLAVPAFLLLALMTALGVGLWFSALNVRYRDVGHVVPFLIQIWMFASPVVYPVSLVPEKWRLLYSLNPMVGVIEGFRWAVLGNTAPNLTILGISTCMVLAVLGGGMVFFKWMERTFADDI